MYVRTYVFHYVRELGIREFACVFTGKVIISSDAIIIYIMGFQVLCAGGSVAAVEVCNLMEYLK